MSSLANRSRDETRRALRTLILLPRPTYEAYRDTLPRRQVPIAILDAARDANSTIGFVNNALRNIQNAERELIASNNRLARSLKSITDYLHDNATQLDPLVYSLLESTRPGQIPNVLDAYPPQPPTPPNHLHSIRRDPSVPCVRPPHPRLTSMSPPQSRPASRHSRRDAPFFEPGYFHQTGRRTGRSVRMEDAESSSRTSDQQGPGYRGPYKLYLAAQDDQYGRDSDGEVRVYDRYEGVEAFDDQPDYEADAEAEE